MPKFKLPIQLNTATRITITQPFGVTSNTLEPVGPNGEPHFHYGIDIITGDDHHTFGRALICPFPTSQVINEFVQPQLSPKTPFIQLGHVAEDGTKYNLTLAHCSYFAPGTQFVLGDTVAKIGNIGLVEPQPTLKDPYAGAHLHLGLQVNGVWVDPEHYFDITSTFPGPDPTPQDQLPATDWLIAQLMAFLKGMGIK